MSIFENISWNFVAGLVTAGFLAILQQFFVRIVRPWFDDRRYKSVRLAGEWRGSYSNADFDSSFRLTLKQNANRVTGTLRIDKITKGSEPSETLNFTLEGSIWEGFFSFSTQSVDDTRLAFGADLYQIKEGGRKLDGIHVYRSLRRDCVSQISLSLKRH